MTAAAQTQLVEDDSWLTFTGSDRQLSQTLVRVYSIQFDQTTQLEPETFSPFSPDSETLSTVSSICPPAGLLPRRPPGSHRTCVPATSGLTTGSKPTPPLPVHVVKPLRSWRGEEEELKGEW